MSPKSKSHSYDPCTRRPLGSDVNVDEFEVTKKLFDKVMALDKCMFNINDDDIEQHVPFNSSCYPDSENTSLYLSPLCSPPWNRTHDKNIAIRN